KDIYSAPNIAANAGTSHIMDKPSLLDFAKACLLPTAPQKCAFIIDAWTTWKDKDNTLTQLIEASGEEIAFYTIPDGATRTTQPLDVMFFRQWKDFVQKFSDKVILEDLDVILYQRDNVLKLQSLVHNQFSAPRFVDFIRYTFHKSGYI